MKTIKTGKVLILTDIHQAIGSYANLVLEKETDWDHIIINGDMLDTFLTPDGDRIYGVGMTCEWINDKFKEWGNKAIWHVANHDVAYMATYTSDYTHTKPSQFYSCSGWTKSKAKTFNKEINYDWIKSLSLCTLLGDNLVVSHAGFNYRMFQPYKSELDNIREYSEKWENEKLTFHHEPWHWIWDVGRCRGGMAMVGSPVWQDWYVEFVPLDNVSQIVGHTTTEGRHEPKYNGRKLANYNIDEMQRCYAIWEDGKVEVKRINDYNIFFDVPE